jgi:very-short-patch-repair endonuclease
MDYDQRRTEWLAREGFRVVRITNADVMQNMDGVLEFIAATLPSPSHPRVRGEGSLPLL